jgi:hypothetical protein
MLNTDSLTITMYNPPRELNTDAIKTLDDIKAILKAMRIGFSGDAAKGIEHLLGEEVVPFQYTPAVPTFSPKGNAKVQDCTNLPNWGESQGSKGHAGMPC